MTNGKSNGYGTNDIARLSTKRVWEKVIGAKFNINDEINQIAQQTALVNTGMAQLSMLGGKTGRKYS